VVFFRVNKEIYKEFLEQNKKRVLVSPWSDRESNSMKSFVSGRYQGLRSSQPVPNAGRNGRRVSHGMKMSKGASSPSPEL
jgi:hypothetical protein